MDIRDYQLEALRTLNRELTSKEVIINAALGLTGESGEVAEHVKKWVFHGHELDIASVTKELGDIAWYLVVMCHAIDVEPVQVLQTNIQKLRDRYPLAFSSQASINRSN